MIIMLELEANRLIKEMSNYESPDEMIKYIKKCVCLISELLF